MPLSLTVRASAPKANSYVRIPALEFRSLRLRQTYGSSIDTISFTVYDKNLQLHVYEGHEIILEETNNANNRLFGGIVQTVSYSDEGIGRSVSVTAQDWTTLLDRSSVILLFHESGQTGLDLIKTAFEITGLSADFADGGEGIDVTSRTIEDKGIASLNFEGTSVSNIMDQVTQLNTFIWWIDPFKRLVYQPRIYLFQAKRFSNSPSEPNHRTFQNFSLTRQLATFNQVHLTGGYNLSPPHTNEYFTDNQNQKKFQIQSERYSIDAEALTQPIEGMDHLIVELNTGTSALPIWTPQRVAFSLDESIIFGEDAEVLWDPIERTVEFFNPPYRDIREELTFRITGRYRTAVRHTVRDEQSIARHKRIFSTTITVPEVLTLAEGIDRGFIFLRRNTDQYQIGFGTYDVPIEVGEVVVVTHSRYGITNMPVLIKQVTMHLEEKVTPAYKVSGNIINTNLYRSESAVTLDGLIGPGFIE